MPVEITDQLRQRVADALADFWYSGVGPSHTEIDAVLARFGLQTEDGLSKRRRIHSAVTECADQDLAGLAEQLVTLLRRWELPTADPMMVGRLRSAMSGLGLELNDLYEVVRARPAQLPAVPNIPALREHIGRAERALRDEDWPQLLGSTKELLESAAKLVLESHGQDIPRLFPALLSSALDVLGLHPRQVEAETPDLEASLRKVLGGGLNIALGIDEYRNTHGTGHGRAAATGDIAPSNARLAVTTGIAVAAWMLDSLE